MSISMTMKREVKLEYSLTKFNSITISFSTTLTYSYSYNISISNSITDTNTVIVLQYYDYYNC